MTDAVLISIIGAVALTASTIATLIMNYKIEKLRSKQAEIKEKQDIIHLEIDGRMQELLQTTKSLANALGNKEGRIELKDEQDKEKH